MTWLDCFEGLALWEVKLASIKVYRPGALLAHVSVRSNHED